MKRNHVPLLALALFLSLALGTVEAADISLTFDGFCDGMTFTTGGSPPVVGSQCGCTSGIAFGTLGVNGGSQAAHFSYAVDADYNGLHTLIRGNHTWEIWNQAGLINSGTWSNGCPVGVVDAPSAASRR